MLALSLGPFLLFFVQAAVQENEPDLLKLILFLQNDYIETLACSYDPGASLNRLFSSSHVDTLSAMWSACEPGPGPYCVTGMTGLEEATGRPERAADIMQSGRRQFAFAVPDTHAQRAPDQENDHVGRHPDQLQPDVVTHGFVPVAGILQVGHLHPRRCT
jgi:hypothetical protein